LFPKASLTGRVVRAKNTMRMAKSWGHRGGPMPAPMCCFAVADKSSQRRDIAKAKRMAKELEGERAMKKAKENVTGNVKHA